MRYELQPSEEKKMKSAAARDAYGFCGSECGGKDRNKNISKMKMDFKLMKREFRPWQCSRGRWEEMRLHRCHACCEPDARLAHKGQDILDTLP